MGTKKAEKTKKPGSSIGIKKPGGSIGIKSPTIAKR